MFPWVLRPLVTSPSFTILAVNCGAPFWSTKVAWFPPKFAEMSGQWRALLRMNTFCEPAVDDFRATVPIPSIFSDAPAFEEVPDVLPKGL
ncbi:uncharacterized protein BT62DRAFT_936956 [Guyanagaster necrorhizus]|uniref:Uncharacterized protein n=1 Tax=Guyanagaster necrorhizus TaxID=856835 RepID=A0A9P8ANE2_9AGAR|nr:uncharacterized protein BT62DRAFT_936956 [Guyanagaster necrorhizus MCA 3950]KAG7441651.1 hypothetical protein BT62DRAFT_936956 [Guyanagaster necrorhizus MCA 3950]